MDQNSDTVVSLMAKLNFWENWFVKSTGKTCFLPDLLLEERLGGGVNGQVAFRTLANTDYL